MHPVLPRCSLAARRAPSVLPLKRPCSLHRTETAILNPKFGVYIIYIYIGGVADEALGHCDCGGVVWSH